MKTREATNGYPERNTVRNHPLPRGSYTYKRTYDFRKHRKELYPQLLALSLFLRTFSPHIARGDLVSVTDAKLDAAKRNMTVLRSVY